MTRTALITGGTGALGVAVVEAFLAAGWRTVVTWIVPSERERIADDERLVPVEADLFDPAAATAAVEAAGNDGEAPLQAVVNLVGGFDAGDRVAELPIERFEEQLRLNLRPTYLVTQAALPRLAKSGGSIACVSARAAVQPFSGASGYIAAKAAVLAFSQAVAVEYRDEGVRCNAVLPSIIDTPGNRASQPDADFTKWVPPAQIAETIQFLCSDESAAISGAAVPVYGRA